MKVLLLTLFVAFVASAPIEDAQDAVEVIVNGHSEGQPLEIGDIVDIKLKEHVDGQVAASSDLLHPYTAVGLAEAAAAAEIDAKPVQVVDVAENEVSPVQVVDIAEVEVKPIEVVDKPIQTLPEVVPEPVVLPSPVAPEVAPEPVILPSPVLPVVAPEAIVLPSPVAPEVAPEPVVLPSPITPEVAPEPVVLPSPVAPEVAPEPVVLPSPVAPEVAPEPVILPEPVVPEPEPVVPEVPEVPEVLPIPAPQLPNGEIFNDGNVQVTLNAPEDPGLLATLQSWVGMVMNYFNGGAQSTQQIL